MCLWHFRKGVSHRFAASVVVCMQPTYNSKVSIGILHLICVCLPCSNTCYAGLPGKGVYIVVYEEHSTWYILRV